MDLTAKTTTTTRNHHNARQIILDVLEKDGVPAALNLTAQLTAPYTPAYYFEEMHVCREQ